MLSSRDIILFPVHSLLYPGQKAFVIQCTWHAGALLDDGFPYANMNKHRWVYKYHITRTIFSIWLRDNNKYHLQQLRAPVCNMGSDLSNMLMRMESGVPFTNTVHVVLGHEKVITSIVFYGMQLFARALTSTIFQLNWFEVKAYVRNSFIMFCIGVITDTCLILMLVWADPCKWNRLRPVKCCPLHDFAFVDCDSVCSFYIVICIPHIAVTY